MSKLTPKQLIKNLAGKTVKEVLIAEGEDNMKGLEFQFTDGSMLSFVNMAHPTVELFFAADGKDSSETTATLA